LNSLEKFATILYPDQGQASMNNDAEAIQQLFDWLLQEPDPAISAPSGNRASRKASPDESGTSSLQPPYFDPLDSEAVDFMPAELDESSLSSFQQPSSLEFGDIPAVQDRFQALLKRRLRAEIERNPPRFPWETGSFDYEVEYSDLPTPERVPAGVWAAQLQTLTMPIPMPDRVLVQLLEQCRTMVQSSLQEGAKLVQVVESLFPGQFQSLNQLAGMVLSGPSRSGQGTIAPPANLPHHYDVATPTQQMALSLLAAREILESMTLKVSPSQPYAQRVWQTTVGEIKVEAEYQPQTQQICIQGTLPQAGSVCFSNGPDRPMADCSEADCVRVALSNLEPNQTYTLEVLLGDSESPFVFAICPLTED
jgi:hypothetical protein